MHEIVSVVALASSVLRGSSIPVELDQRQSWVHIKLQTFLDAAEAVRANADAEPQIVNTICSATRDRQDAARALAGHVDAFFIIGGRHSSNSVKLLAVCKEQCDKSFLIETPLEINPAVLEGVDRVGVTAGASTPNWLIDQVVARLHEIGTECPR